MLKLNYDEKLLNESARTEITATIATMIQQYQHQPEQLNVMTIESASLVQSIQTRCNAAQEQNKLVRFLNHITGRTTRFNLDNAADVAKLMYLAQQSLNELQARQLITLEAVLVIANHLNLLQGDVYRLQEGVIGLQDQVSELYGQVLEFFQATEERLDKVERETKLLVWAKLITTSKPVWQRKSYKQIDPAAKLLCMANDFFHEAQGKWAEKDWYLLEGCLNDVGLDPQTPIHPADLFHGEQASQLLARWLKGIAEPDDLEELATASAPLAFALLQQRQYRDRDKHVIDHIHESLLANGINQSRESTEWKSVVKHVQQYTGRALDQPVSAHELLWDLVGNLFVLDNMTKATGNNSPHTNAAIENQPLPPVQSIHGWPADKVQTLQNQTAQQALNKPVVFRDKLKSGGEGPDMVIIPAGKFIMGSPDDEPERYDSEGPQHEVAFAKPFAIGKYALTFEDYDRYCVATGTDKPGDLAWGRGRRPVINVSWHDAQNYCAWLSEQTGRSYRLPTEAEWEYACRAGTITPFHWGSTITTQQANYDGNFTYANGSKGEYRGKTVQVEQFSPNPFGLYQLHGNVWEWCEDGWHSGYHGAPSNGSIWEGDGAARVLRGGSWGSYPSWVALRLS